MENKFISAANFAKTLKKSVFLFKKLWKENTTALLHSRREADKSSLIFDIAEKITSSGRQVLYVNTERRLENNADKVKPMPGLFVFTPEYESPEDKTDYADLVIAGIEEAVATTEIRTFIVDSVTRIAALSFGRNASAAYIMKRLIALQVRCKISLLVISHDSTKAADRALLNLADSEITLDSENLEASDTQAIADTAKKKADAPTVRKENVPKRPSDNYSSTIDPSFIRHNYSPFRDAD